MYKAQDIAGNMASGKGRIPVGIHENCKVTKVETGDNFIDFYYEDQQQRSHNKRVWFPTPDKVWPKDGETKVEAFERSQKEALAHVVKHLHIFLPEKDFNKFEAENFEQFVEKAAKVLPKHLESKTVNLKLIYDKDGVYSTFGNYPDYIEEWSADQKCGLFYTKWERENRLESKVEEAINASDEAVVKIDDQLY